MRFRESVLLLGIGLVSLAFVRVQACRRPDGTDGYCVSLKDCSSVLAAYKGITGPDDVAALQSLTCYNDAVKGSTYVCCDVDIDVDNDAILPGKGVCGRTTNEQTHFPWMVRLEFASDFSLTVCTGSLINHVFVLTSRECALRSKIVAVWLGEYDRDCDDKTKCADRIKKVGIVGYPDIYTHPNYLKYYPSKHNIALIRLAEHVQYTKYISPICMPSVIGLKESAGGTKMTAWDFSPTATNNSVKTIIDFSVCVKRYKQNLDVDRSMVCAGGADTCIYYFGAPLIVKKDEHWAIEGVDMNCFSSEENLILYSSVPYHEQWIRDTIAQLNTNLQAGYFPRKGECGQDSLTDKIYGGTEAALTDFPWMALLEYEEHDSIRCTGSLVNHRYVVTAAHCTRFPIVRVRLGEYDTRTDPDCDPMADCADPVLVVGVNRIHIHPRYHKKQFDIAMVRLDADVKYTDYISPICLPWIVGLERSPANTVLTVSGWGQTVNRTVSAVKRKADVPIYDQLRCADKFDDLTDIQICAGGEPDVDSCQGDSGGPLMRWKDNYFTLEGIVSFGRMCGLEGWPTIYTRIASFEQWMNDVIRHDL